MSTDEACQILGISRQQVRDYIRQGRIKAQQIGRVWVINRASLMKFKASFTPRFEKSA